MATPTADTLTVPAGTAVVYGGRAGGAAAPAEFQVAAAGGWTWFNDDRAVVDASATYVGFNAGAGGGGDLRAARIDAATGAITSGVVATGFSQDDHAVPALVVRPTDGRLLAFYAGVPDSTVRYRVASAQGSVEAWSSELLMPTPPGTYCAYANPRWLSGPGVLLVFTRVLVASGARAHVYCASSDGGATWGAWRKVIEPTAAWRPYLLTLVNGTDEIHALYADMHPADGQSSIYHVVGKWSATDGALRWYRSDGSQITAALPLLPSDGTLVYSGATQRGWNWGLTVDTAGRPRALFTKYPSNSGDDIRLMTSRWTGSAWSTPVDIVGGSVGSALYAQEPFYTGGAAFDSRDANRVYLAREVASGIYEMQKWASADDGTTWAKVRDLSTATPIGQDNARPFSPRNYHGNVAVVWWRGTYSAWDNFNTAVYAANNAG